jgi:hypothetical protein
MLTPVEEALRIELAPSMLQEPAKHERSIFNFLLTGDKSWIFAQIYIKQRGLLLEMTLRTLSDHHISGIRLCSKSFSMD